MTKVDLHFQLVRPLGDGDLESIARVNAVYGIQRVVLSLPGMDAVDVEYDATRMSPDDVRAALLRCGIPVAA